MTRTCRTCESEKEPGLIRNLLETPPKPNRLTHATPWLRSATLALLAGLLLTVPASGQPAKPFGLPVAEPPGLGTWYIAQPYGNTVYAHAERRTLYGAGQGLHMGIDLAMACGTTVVAIGDGVVLSVDGRGGSPPHNLMIDHQNGYVSLYGHLLERPQIPEGARVKRGDPVALSGDMYSTCYSSPHLHLEIRKTSLGDVVNPVTLIDADWHSLLLMGLAGPAFERDLDQPQRWQSLDDQPPIRLGGPLLNDFERAWPAGGR